MRWPVFAITVYLLLALQMSVASAMRLELSAGVVEPRLMLPLLVFVGLSAAPQVAIIAAGVMGLALDATTVWPLAEGQGLTVLGPYALGYLAAAAVLLQVRPMVFRQHPLAFAVMIVLAGAAVQLVVVGIFSIRIWYDPLAEFSATRELFVRSLSLGYSAVVGAALSLPLVGAAPLFGFTGTTKRRRR